MKEPSKVNLFKEYGLEPLPIKKKRKNDFLTEYGLEARGEYRPEALGQSQQIRVIIFMKLYKEMKELPLLTCDNTNKEEYDEKFDEFTYFMYEICKNFDIYDQERFLYQDIAKGQTGYTFLMQLLIKKFSFIPANVQARVLCIILNYVNDVRYEWCEESKNNQLKKVTTSEELLRLVESPFRNPHGGGRQRNKKTVRRRKRESTLRRRRQRRS